MHEQGSETLFQEKIHANRNFELACVEVSENLIMAENSHQTLQAYDEKVVLEPLAHDNLPPDLENEECACISSDFQDMVMFQIIIDPIANLLQPTGKMNFLLFMDHEHIFSGHLELPSFCFFYLLEGSTSMVQIRAICWISYTGWIVTHDCIYIFSRWAVIIRI